MQNKLGVFNGTCAIVPFLKAPGFAKLVATEGRFGPHFNNASKHIAGGMELRVRSSTPTYAGFRVAFAAKGVPRTRIHGGGSFKAGFDLQDSKDFQTVFVPFNKFSYDWSGYTGRCDTKDPQGQQHHCCNDPGTGDKYCPKAEFLGKITDVEVWAEGVAGDFHLEIDYVGASDGATLPSDNVVEPTVSTIKDGTTMFYFIEGSKCGQFTLRDGDTPYAKRVGYQTGDCSSHGYTVADGSKRGALPIYLGFIGENTMVYFFTNAIQ